MRNCSPDSLDCARHFPRAGPPRGTYRTLAGAQANADARPCCKVLIIRTRKGEIDKIQCFGLSKARQFRWRDQTMRSRWRLLAILAGKVDPAMWVAADGHTVRAAKKDRISDDDHVTGCNVSYACGRRQLRKLLADPLPR